MLKSLGRAILEGLVLIVVIAMVTVLTGPYFGMVVPASPYTALSILGVIYVIARVIMLEERK